MSDMCRQRKLDRFIESVSEYSHRDPFSCNLENIPSSTALHKLGSKLNIKYFLISGNFEVIDNTIDKKSFVVFSNKKGFSLCDLKSYLITIRSEAR